MQTQTKREYAIRLTVLVGEVRVRLLLGLLDEAQPEFSVET